MGVHELNKEWIYSKIPGSDFNMETYVKIKK